MALHLLTLPSETREDRTKRLFRHYTVGSYDSLTSHRYRRRGRGGWAGAGLHAGRTSNTEGGRKLVAEAWGRRGQRRGGDPQPTSAFCLPASVRGHLPRVGCACRVLSGAHLGSARWLCSPAGLSSPPPFPPPVTMSLTTRWPSFRNGTTRALVLCSGERKVMGGGRLCEPACGAGVSGRQGWHPARGVSYLCSSSLLFLPPPCPTASLLSLTPAPSFAPASPTFSLPAPLAPMPLSCP